MHWLEFTDVLGRCNAYSDWNRVNYYEAKEKPSLSKRFRAACLVIKIFVLNRFGFKVSACGEDHRSIKNEVKDTVGMDVRYPC